MNLQKTKVIIMWGSSLEKALDNPSRRQLVLPNLGMKKIPVIIWQAFPSLEVLDLSGNQIKTIPKGILKLHQLKRLIIADNHLLRLPSHLNQLEYLKVLDVQNNRLHTIEALPPSLEVLNLSKNKLKAFPTAIKTCTQLLHLDLSSNKLKELPALHNIFCALQYLNVSHCRLNKLGLLPTYLYALFLARNSMAKLPENWQELSQLQRLDVGYNPIKIELSDHHQLRQLSYLDVNKTKTKWPGLLWLLDQFPELTYSVGGFSVKQQKELSALIQISAQKPPSLSKKALLLLLKRKEEKLFTDQILGFCLQKGVHADIQAAAFGVYVKRHSFKINRTIKGLRFAVSGTIFQDKEILKTRLHEQGAFLLSEHTEADVVMLGCGNWQDFDCSRSKKIITERNLIIWLDKKEGRYLTNTKNKAQLHNIERLLKSKDDATLNLGIALLKPWGTPLYLLVLLLEKWLCATSAQKEKLGLILRPYLPTEINILLESNDKSLFPLAVKEGKRKLWALIKIHAK